MHIVQVIVLGNENLHKILHPPLSPSLLSRHCCHILACSFHLAYLDIVTGIKAVFLVLTQVAKICLKAPGSGTYFWSLKILGIYT